MIRRTPLKPWSRPKADQVTPEMRLAILERDQGCIPDRLGAPGECAGRLEIMHIREQAGTKRPKSDEAHLVAGCSFHHGTLTVGGGWGTTKVGMAALRAYLRDVAQRVTA